MRPIFSFVLRDAKEHGRGYFVVKPKIAFEEAQSLRSLQLDWIDIERKSERHYPGGPLAAHVLGSVDFEEKGNAGIEKALESDLRGVPGHILMLTDVKRRGIDSQLESGARPGAAITLTIDERLQFVAERELAAAVQTPSRRNRQRGGDQSADRRYPGAGQLSHLRSEPSATTRRKRCESAESCALRALRAGFRIQDDHTLRRA